MENWNQRWRRQTSNRTSLKNRLVSEFSEQKMLATTLFSNFAFPRFSGMSLWFVHIYGLKSCSGFIPKLARDWEGSSNLRLFPTGLCLTLPQEHRIKAGSHWPTDDYWFLIFLLEIQSCQENVPSVFPVAMNCLAKMSLFPAHIELPKRDILSGTLMLVSWIFFIFWLYLCRPCLCSGHCYRNQMLQI